MNCDQHGQEIWLPPVGWVGFYTDRKKPARFRRNYWCEVVAHHRDGAVIMTKTKRYHLRKPEEFYFFSSPLHGDITCTSIS